MTPEEKKKAEEARKNETVKAVGAKAVGTTGKDKGKKLSDNSGTKTKED